MQGPTSYKFPCQIYDDVIFRALIVSLLALSARPSGISFRANTFKAVSIIHTCPSMFTGIDVAWLWFSYSCLISNTINQVIWPQLFKRSIAPRVVLNKCLYGEALPRGPTFIYHFLRKGTPFVYLLLTNGTPFTYLVQNFASLLTAVNALSFKQ